MDGKNDCGFLQVYHYAGAFLPSYNKGTDGKLVLRTSADQPDESFTIEEEFNYIVEANLFTGVITLTQTENLRPAYDQLYFVGGMNDWGFVPMKRMCSIRSCSAMPVCLMQARAGNSSSELRKEAGRACIRQRMPMPLTPIRKWYL